MPMRVVVVSDTHAPRRWKACPALLARSLAEADVVLHAGDVCTAAVLEELSAYAPVHAVMGNNDLPEVAAWGAPEVAELTLEGLRVAMVHDSGQAKGRLQRLRSAFPAADLVVFGHSHIPWDESLPAASDAGEAPGFRILNPGSPTDRRRQPTGSFLKLDISNGAVLRSELVRIPPATATGG